MPRFFFNSRDGEVIEDFEGVELADLAAAKREAVVFAGELLRSTPALAWDGDFQIEVVDGQRLVLAVVSVIAFTAPAGEPIAPPLR